MLAAFASINKLLKGRLAAICRYRMDTPHETIDFEPLNISGFRKVSTECLCQIFIVFSLITTWRSLTFWRKMHPIVRLFNLIHGSKMFVHTKKSVMKR